MTVYYKSGILSLQQEKGIIMKPERTLQMMYNDYPHLFPTRQRALNHLFCVIGNGYEWKNGELVDDEYEYFDNDVDDEYEYFDNESDIISKSPMTEEEYEVQHQKWIEDKVELKCSINKGLTREKALKVTLENYHKWYPISKKFSFICNLPNDITPEWKALADECKEMLKKDGIII